MALHYSPTTHLYLRGRKDTSAVCNYFRSTARHPCKASQPVVRYVKLIIYIHGYLAEEFIQGRALNVGKEKGQKYSLLEHCTTAYRIGNTEDLHVSSQFSGFVTHET